MIFGKKWWLGTDSNRRHKDFQSYALPTELPSHILNTACQKHSNGQFMCYFRPPILMYIKYILAGVGENAFKLAHYNTFGKQCFAIYSQKK